MVRVLSIFPHPSPDWSGHCVYSPIRHLIDQSTEYILPSTTWLVRALSIFPHPPPDWSGTSHGTKSEEREEAFYPRAWCMLTSAYVCVCVCMSSLRKCGDLFQDTLTNTHLTLNPKICLSANEGIIYVSTWVRLLHAQAGYRHTKHRGPWAPSPHTYTIYYACG
jgi:hypothetical protein